MSLKKYMNLRPLKLYHGLFGPTVGPTMLAYHTCWSITRSYCVAVYKEIVCNDRTWPQKCWKSCANGSNIVAPRFGDHGTKEMYRVLGSKVCPVSNFA